MEKKSGGIPLLLNWEVDIENSCGCTAYLSIWLEWIFKLYTFCEYLVAICLVIGEGKHGDETCMFEVCLNPHVIDSDPAVGHLMS